MIFFYLIALVVTFLGVVINLPGTVHMNPILLNFYDVKTVLFLVAIYKTFDSLCRIIVFRKEIVKEHLVQIVILGMFGGLVGSYLLDYINEKILILVFLFSGFKFLYEYYSKKKNQVSSLEKTLTKKHEIFLDTFIAGFVASFLQVFGIGTGPIRQGYYLSKGHSLGSTQGTVGFMFLFSGLAIVSTRVFFGGMDPKLILVILPLFPFILAIVYFGKYVIYKIPKVWQDRVIIYSLVISLLTVLPKLFNIKL